MARTGGSGGPIAESAGEGEKMDEGINGDGTRRYWDADALRREGVSTDEYGAKFPRERKPSRHAIAFMKMCGGKAVGRCVCKIFG